MRNKIILVILIGSICNSVSKSHQLVIFHPKDNVHSDDALEDFETHRFKRGVHSIEWPELELEPRESSVRSRSVQTADLMKTADLMETADLKETADLMETADVETTDLKAADVDAADLKGLGNVKTEEEEIADFWKNYEFHFGNINKHLELNKQINSERESKSDAVQAKEDKRAQNIESTNNAVEVGARNKDAKTGAISNDEEKENNAAEVGTDTGTQKHVKHDAGVDFNSAAEHFDEETEKNAKVAEEDAKKATEEANKANEDAKKAEEDAKNAEEEAKKAMEEAKKAMEEAKIAKKEDKENPVGSSADRNFVPTDDEIEAEIFDEDDDDGLELPNFRYSSNANNNNAIGYQRPDKVYPNLLYRPVSEVPVRQPGIYPAAGTSSGATLQNYQPYYNSNPAYVISSGRASSTASSQQLPVGGQQPSPYLIPGYVVPSYAQSPYPGFPLQPIYPQQQFSAYPYPYPYSSSLPSVVTVPLARQSRKVQVVPVTIMTSSK